VINTQARREAFERLPAEDFLDQEGMAGENGPKLRKALDEVDAYVVANQPLIPNYGERWRNEETIAKGFVESAVNPIVSKRFVKSSRCSGRRKAPACCCKCVCKCSICDWE